MKTHKIRNIDKSICCAEQKIAYNIAFRCDVWKHNEFEKLRAIYPGEANRACHDLRDFYIKQYKAQYPHSNINLDAVFHCLTNGLYNYMCNPFIATDYETIGKAFPILYEQE